MIKTKSRNLCSNEKRGIVVEMTWDRMGAEVGGLPAAFSHRSGSAFGATAHDDVHYFLIGRVRFLVKPLCFAT